MDKDKFVELIKACSDTIGRFSPSKYKKTVITYPIVQDMIDTIGFKPRTVYCCIQRGNLDFKMPECPTCHKIMPEERYVDNKEYCCAKCAQSSPLMIERIAKTKMERYGDPHYTNPDKTRKTNLAKYGVVHPFESPEIQAKVNQTVLEKYGVDNVARLQEVKDKSRHTMMEKYGVEYFSQHDTWLEKTMATNRKNYGTDFPMQNEDTKANFCKVSLEKYGVDNPFKNPEFVEKNVRHHRELHFDIFVKLMNAKMIDVLSTKEQYVDNYIKLKCRQCGHEWEQEVDGSQHIRCENCASKYTSIPEKQVFEFVQSIYKGRIVENTRKILSGKRELDIYIPEKNLAIEYNGNWFHSAEKRGDKFHQEKTLECERLGIRLIHIFQWEWHYDRPKMEALIKSALGIFDHTIYARQCVVKEIDTQTYNEFLELYHIQGGINSKVRLGLYHNDELVSVIGFGASRFEKNIDELHRYCVKPGYRIIGGFSRLLKHSGITKCISYVDASHFDGHGYEAVGFKRIGVTPPGYVYTKGNEMLSRYQCQKSMLPKLLGERFDSNLTEVENMISNGYMMVYNSGNYKYLYDTTVNG